MLIIISPTKQMKVDRQYKGTSIPCLALQSSKILSRLQMLSSQDVITHMKVNEKIAEQSIQRYQELRYDIEGSAAIHTYNGLQFKHIDIPSFVESDMHYIQEHLRILSGLYGIVKPNDSVYPYRLEMQFPMQVEDHKSLYEYWGSSLSDQLLKEVAEHEEKIILNLASKEYEKVILPYLSDGQYINISFKVDKKGKIKSESTQVKMARGAMIKYLAKQQVQRLEDVKKFCDNGYHYKESLSSAKEFVFLKMIEN